MFRFMLAKLKHKKWMVLCLLIGNVLLIAVSASQSIYKTASFERMFEEEFDRKKVIEIYRNEIERILKDDTEATAGKN